MNCKTCLSDISGLGVCSCSSIGSPVCCNPNTAKTVKVDIFNIPQPAPKKNEHPAVWDLVVADMKERDNTGYKKYGTRLQPHNGRDAMVDAYQEALDLAVYLRLELFQKYGE